MRKLVSSILAVALLGASLAMPLPSVADELPLCSEVADPATTPCTGPTSPTGTTESTGPTNPTCAEVPDPTTIPCTGPTDAEPEYNWVWNGTAWEAEGYPWVWDGTQWIPAPPPILSATIENTGPDSTNEASASSTSDTTATVDNDATIDNNIDATLNTGNNSVLANTAAGDLTSGGIQMTVELLNFINSVTALSGGTLTMVSFATDPNGDIDLTQLSPEILNAVLAYYVGSIFDIIAQNSNTGPDSTNTSNASSETNTTIDSTHDASIDNNVSLAANTGNNTASYNTEVGNLTTGNIDVMVNLINIINSILSVPVLDMFMLNFFGDLTGNIYLPEWLSGASGTVSPLLSASNSNTGPDSTNTADASSTNNLNVTATNDASTTNTLDINANTGGNTVSDNTGVGNLTTGNVNTQLTLTDIIQQITGDSWFLIFVNVLGEWTGQILGLNVSNGEVIVLSGPQLAASNSNTGPDSTNTATASSENNTTINHDSNAAINNALTLDLNTGNNSVTHNTQAGNLTTGNINVLGNIVNIINQAINLNQRLFLGFINIMGNWFGSLGPRSAFPTPAAVGGNTDSGNQPVVEIGSAASPATESNAESTATTSPSSTRRSDPAFNTGGGQIEGGETIVFTPEAVAGFTLPNAQAAGTVTPWKLISIALFAFGLLLLVADTLLRRRSSKIE